MMYTCVVQSCASTSHRNPTLEFFRIPKDSSMKDEWMDILSLKNRQVSESTRVCELHFRSKDFIDSVSGKKRLKHHALPVLKIGRKSVSAEDSDEEFMQCASDSDPEIVEVKEISKHMTTPSRGKQQHADEKDEPTKEESPPEPELGRRPSRRAAQLAVKKIHNTVRSFALTPEAAEKADLEKAPVEEPKPAPRIRKTPPTAPKPVPPKRLYGMQKTWHSIRAPQQDIDLLMECHEELLTAAQAEALMRAQAEYNKVMKTLRTLRANNVRIVCTTGDEPEPVQTPVPAPPPPQKISAVLAPHKPSGVVAIAPATPGQTSSITVVPIHLVTVQGSTIVPSSVATIKPASPSLIVSSLNCQ